MNAELIEALNAMEKEKGISKEVLIEAIETSLLTACKNIFGKNDNVEVNFDRETADFEIYLGKKVVEEVKDPNSEISLEAAMEINGALGLGDIYRQKVESKNFGRIATQNAKNVMLQKIREEERRTVYDTYYQKEHQLVSGTIQRQLGHNLTVKLEKADALLNENEQVKTENYYPGGKIKVYVLEVKDNSKGPRILVSRTHPELVKKLFEAEVIEIQTGVVEIKAISREAGSRTKMAVWSNDENVDPIGACVGQNGSRVGAVVNELNGEKIDIINWSDNSAELIENAISPAKVICVLADDEEKTAMVIVPDYQLSLAIGKMGQNARLAARLTGYKIDIKSETQARESGLFEEIGFIEDYDENFEEEPYYEEGEAGEENAVGSETAEGEEPEAGYEEQ